MTITKSEEVERQRCREEDVVLNESFRKRMAKNIKRNKKILQELAKI
jgi:hypothetical protein